MHEAQDLNPIIADAVVDDMLAHDKTASVRTEFRPSATDFWMLSDCVEGLREVCFIRHPLPLVPLLHRVGFDIAVVVPGAT